MTSPKILAAVLLSPLLVLGSVDRALGQAARQAPIQVKKLSGSKVNTPVYDVRVNVNRGSTPPKTWFVIETEYDATPEWTDQLDFTYYALVKTTTTREGFMLLKSDVSYVNIPRGRRLLSNMFIHPHTLLRYGDVQRVAVVVRQSGVVVAMESQPSSTTRWWEQLPPVEGLMLNRTQSPFALHDIDAFQQIKPAP